MGREPKNVSEAIERSISHNEIVTLDWSPSREADLRARSDDSTDSQANNGAPIDEYWANDDAGGMAWRVHLYRAPAYQLDADMMGSEFCGALGDLYRFREILAEQCWRPIETLVVSLHVAQPPGAEEPGEHDWNAALDTFAGERPELWEGGG